MLKLIIFVLMMVVGSRVADAQYSSQSLYAVDEVDGFEDVFNFTIWLESALVLSPFDLGLYSKGNFQRSNRISAIRGIVMGDAVSSGVDRQNHYEELGVMYGWASDPDVIHYSISGGISAIRIAGEEQDEPEFTTGFPVDVALSYRPSPLLGVGVSAFANFNNVENIGGLALRVDIGLMR